MSDITKLHFENKRVNLQLEQLRSQLKHAMEAIGKLRSDLESLKAKSGSVAAGNMPESEPLPVPEAVHE